MFLWALCITVGLGFLWQPIPVSATEQGPPGKTVSQVNECSPGVPEIQGWAHCTTQLNIGFSGKPSSNPQSPFQAGLKISSSTLPQHPLYCGTLTCLSLPIDSGILVGKGCVLTSLYPRCLLHCLVHNTGPQNVYWNNNWMRWTCEFFLENSSSDLTSLSSLWKEMPGLHQYITDKNDG